MGLFWVVVFLAVSALLSVLVLFVSEMDGIEDLDDYCEAARQ